MFLNVDKLTLEKSSGVCSFYCMSHEEYSYVHIPPNSQFSKCQICWEYWTCLESSTTNPTQKHLIEENLVLHQALQIKEMKDYWDAKDNAKLFQPISLLHRWWDGPKYYNRTKITTINEGNQRAVCEDFGLCPYACAQQEEKPNVSPQDSPNQQVRHTNRTCIGSCFLCHSRLLGCVRLEEECHRVKLSHWQLHTIWM